MKRMLCLLLALGVLCAGCAAPPDDSGAKAPQDEPTVTVQVKEADLTADKPTITLAWYNGTDNTIQATNDFGILRFDTEAGGAYLDCFDSTHPYADAQFTLYTYEIAPSQITEVTYDVSAYILPPTRVLLFQAHYIVNDGDEPSTAECYFTISNDQEVSPIYTNGVTQNFNNGADHTLPENGTVSDEPKEVGGVSVTIEKQYIEDDKTVLDIVWHNTTKREATFGEPYDILYLGNGAAESCLIDPDTVWIMPAYLLPPGGTFEKTYYPERLFDLSRKGRYQFRSSYHIATPDGETMQSFVIAHFTIE